MSSILDNPPEERKSTGSGSMTGYHVEARTSHGRDVAFEIAGTMVTSAWRRIKAEAGNGFGVPISRGYHEPQLRMAELMDYPCAQAIRWWFTAVANSMYKNVETRLVEHEITWSWSSMPRAAFAEVDVQELMYPIKKP